MTKDEALKLALEALKWNWGGEPLPTLELEAITAIEQALAQPNEFNPDWDAMSVLVEEQQRMAKRIAELEAHPVLGAFDWEAIVGHDVIELPWIGLTDDEIETIYANCNAWDKFEYERMLEAKLKEKNT